MLTSLLAQAAVSTPTTLPAPALTADHVLAPHVWVFYAAFLIAFVFTPVMRVVATYYGIIDQPDLTRKLHAKPVAYLGGVAMFLGWLAAIAISQASRSIYNPIADAWMHVRISPAILGAACIIVGLGLWDDIKHVHPNLKILGQVLAAGMLLWAGIGPNSTRPLLAPIDSRMQAWFHSGLPEWVFILTGCCLTIGLVVFCCNAVNLMDGLDGLAGGVTSIIAMGFLFLAVYMAVISGFADAQGSALRIVIAIALLGAVLGFVPYNFNPASIFMGDTGSMFLGFACALLIVMMAELDTRWLLASLVMFALPVLDTSLAFARRWVNRRPVFSADRMHFHHQLVMRGLTIRKTVLLSYVLTIGFVLLGSAIVFMRTRYAIAIYLVVFGSIIVSAYKMGMVHEKSGVLEVNEDDKRRSISEAQS